MTKKILIAEDDAVLRSIYVKKFAMAGLDVRTAENGEQVVEMIHAEPPDLLICDIHMPKKDGFQVLQAFPKDQRSFPIILLTNFDQDEFKNRAKSLGANEYFVKKDMTIHMLLDMSKRLMGS